MEKDTAWMLETAQIESNEFFEWFNEQVDLVPHEQVFLIIFFNLLLSRWIVEYT